MSKSNKCLKKTFVMLITYILHIIIFHFAWNSLIPILINGTNQINLLTSLITYTIINVLGTNISSYNDKEDCPDC